MSTLEHDRMGIHLSVAAMDSQGRKLSTVPLRLGSDSASAVWLMWVQVRKLLVETVRKKLGAVIMLSPPSETMNNLSV